MTKRVKRTASIILIAVLALFCGTLAVLSFSSESANAQEKYSDYTNTTVFVIENEADYVAFATLYSGKSNSFKGKTVRLYTDIDADKAKLYFPNFLGKFEGNGHFAYNFSSALFGVFGSSSDKTAVLSDLNFVSDGLAGAAVADINYGKISDVSVFGTATLAANAKNAGGGLVNTNYGTITDCVNATDVVLSSSIIFTYGGIAYSNASSGNIENSAFLGNVKANSVTTNQFSVAAVAFLNAGTLSGVSVAAEFIAEGAGTDGVTFYAFTKGANGDVSTGTLQNSASLIYVSGETVSNSQASTIENSYSVTILQTDEGGEGNTEVLYPVEGAFRPGTADNLASLGQDFLYGTGYPVPKTLFSGEGSDSSPFEINGVADLFRIKFASCSGNAFSYELTSEINLKNIPEISAVSGFTAQSGKVKGNGHALYNCVNGTVFEQGYNLTGDNVGFILCSGNSLSGNEGDGYINENHDFGKDEISAAITARTPAGTGTATDPYIITDASTLKWLDGKEGYAVLSNDIVVNYAGDGTSYALGISELKVTLYGNGKAVIGLVNEPLCQTLSGAVSNLILRSYGGRIADTVSASGKVNTVTAIVSSSDTGAVSANNGTITDFVLYGTYRSAGIAKVNNGTIKGGKIYASSINGYAFTSENKGTVELSENFGATAYAFVSSATGVIKNSVNHSTETSAYSGSNTDGIATSLSIGTQNEKPYYTVFDTEGVKTETADVSAYALKDTTFDFETVFGYPVGDDVPELRTAGKSYKQKLSQPFLTFTPSSSVYSKDQTYTLKEVQSYITTEETADSVFSWTYNGEAFGKADSDGEGSHNESTDGESSDNESADDKYVVHNAGVYAYTVSYAGSDDYLPAQASGSFEITKAKAPAAFSVTGFENVTETYKGESFTYSNPAIVNGSVFTNAGYAFSQSWKKGNQTVLSCLDVGIYTHTFSGTSTNYADVKVSRTVTVAKAVLNVTVGNLTVNYGEEMDFSKKKPTMSVSGQVGQDNDKTLQQLVSDYGNGFSTDYKAGDGVGEYALSFAGTCDNYVLEVTDGVLTVKALAFSEEDKQAISFYGATETVYGFQAEYSGEEIILAATFPEGVSVVYSGNDGNVNVGEYTVTAVFSKPNYEDFTLKVLLTITRATLTVTPTAAPSVYGQGVSLSGAEIEVEGFKGTDSFESVFGNATAVYSVWADGAEQAEGTVLNADSYILKVSLPEADNYELHYVDGVYLVNKASLTILYENNNSENKDFADFTTEYVQNLNVVRTITFFTSGVDVTYVYKKDGAVVEGITSAGNFTITAIVTPSEDGEYYKNYLPTEYICAVTVHKRTRNLSFKQQTFTVNYDSENHAYIDNFDYESNLYEGTEVIFRCLKDGAESEAIHAGEYTIVISASETENELACFAEAKLIISPAVVTLTYPTSYVYSGNAASPVPTSVSGVFNDELAPSDYSYVFRIGDRVVDAPSVVGSYNFTVTSLNPDYVFEKSDFSFEITKLPVAVVWGSVSFEYGTSGYVTVDGVTYNVQKTAITRTLYTPEGTELQLSLTVNIPDYAAGVYTLTDENLVHPTNYRYYFEEGGTNEVRITPRTLTVVWKLDGKDWMSNSYETEYKGYSQTYRFTYVVGNTAYEEKSENLELSVSVSGSGDILHAGEYILLLSLKNSANYVLSSSAKFTVRVTKVGLQISIADVDIMRGESFYSATYTVKGLVGQDVGKTLSDLSGASVRTICAYTPTAPTGAKFDISMQATFDDYEATVIRNGILTVVANTYPDYVLTDVYQIYSGNYYEVTIPSVPSEITVVYSNNRHRDAGTYTVGATVTYPTGRQLTSTCRLTIVSATPVITLLPKEMIYLENVAMTDDMITGEAKVGDMLVTGSFAFVNAETLREGRQEYACIFIPDDTLNVKETACTLTVTSARVDMSVFVFDDPSKITFTDNDVLGKAEITGTVRMSLKPVLKGLSLRREGYEVEYVEFNSAGEVNVEVYFEGQKAFGCLFEITYVDLENPQEIIIGVDSFKPDNIIIENDTIKVSPEGGRLSLEEEYASDYSLYVNGLYYDEFILNGNEGEITVVVKTKNISVTVYTQIFKVSVQENITEDPKDYKIYYIVGGCVLGVAAIVTVIVIVWKKKYG